MANWQLIIIGTIVSLIVGYWAIKSLKKEKVSDVLALGLLLLAIYLFFFIIGTTKLLLTISGIVGCIMIIISQIVYLGRVWSKK